MSPLYEIEIVGIPGFTGYGASRDGRIWSRKRIGGQGSLQDEWRELRQSCVRGYGHVGAHGDDSHLEVMVHRLIAITFIGPIPKDKEINNKNGNKRDNSVENLEIVTHQENMVHTLNTGIRIPAHGEKHHWSKISDTKVSEIKTLYASGHYTQRELAKMFGVAQSHIGRLARGERRKEAA